MRLAAIISALCFGVAAAGAAAAPASAAADEPAYGPELQGFEYSVAGFVFLLQCPGRDPGHGLYGRETAAAANGENRLIVPRQEFLRGDLAGRHRRLEQSRLPGDRRRSDRVLQIDQAGALSVQFPAASRKYPRPDGFARNQPRDPRRPFPGGMLGIRYALMYPGDGRSGSCSSIRSGSRIGKPRACPGKASTPGT